MPQFDCSVKFNEHRQHFEYGDELPVRAVVGVDLAVDATEARRAGAGVAVDTIGAVGAVPAGVTLTLVYVLLASAAAKPRQTGAREAVDAVAAQTTITAGI